jgi:transcriptional regulator of acetoin/glycerol metabolism
VAEKLRVANGNVTRAASLAGMQRPNFKREMRRLQIDSGVDGGDDPTGGE